MSTTKQSFQVTTNHQLSLLSLSAWTNSQLLSLLKPWKAAGLDDLLTYMLQHLGNKAKSWLLDMINGCTSSKHIPSIWRKAKVIAIPKPGKDPSSPKSYRPISLLCIPYKLYERLILMRISPLSMRSWQNTMRSSDLVVNVPVISSTWLSTSITATKEKCWQVQHLYTCQLHTTQFNTD